MIQFKDKTTIEKYSLVRDNVTIGHCSHIDCFVLVKENAVIGDNVIIENRVTIETDVEIGNNATILQGSIVTKNVPDGETWSGNPAKKCKTRIVVIKK